MKKIAVTLIVLLLIFGSSVIAEEETKVLFSAVKSSCYGQIDMTKSEFILSEVGRECVVESWLETNLSEVEAKVEENKDSKDSTEEVSWNIYSVDDISLGQVKKYEFRVVVNGAVTPEEIKQIGKQVIEVAKRETPFNALVIFFYDYPEYAEGSYTLAKATMAPDGKYEKADTVSTGNYKGMEVTWNDIRKKDWDDQLTPEEVEIWDRWDELLWEKVDTPEDEIAKMVAKEFDVSLEKVKKIADKEFIWVYQDLGE